jgi:two-component system sensor histidine kinase KdpD
MIAAITGVESSILAVNSTTVALTFVLAVLLCATWWGLAPAIVAAVGGVLCFNYFFLPPVGTFNIADTENWVALFAFLATAIIASQLSSNARSRAEEATRRQRELEKLYDLSRSLLLLDSKAGVPGQLAYQIARVFDIPAVALFDRQGDQVYRAGPRELAVRDSALRDAAMQGTAAEDAAAGASILPLTLGGSATGSLAVGGGSLSSTALHAVANLAAITLERGRAQEIATQAAVARQNQELKSTLLDALAHELKTPLTSIKAAISGLLAGGELPQTELLTIVEEETDRLDSLVNEAIQMARVEAGQVQLDLQPRVVSEIVARALKTAARALEDRSVTVDLADELPDVLADGKLVESLIRHLIGNSLKYAAPDSGIEIRAWGEEAEVAIAVKDHGPGIPDREQSRIFDRFYRSAGSATAAPGTGMGLAIARQIAEAHGGRLEIRSAPGQGSEFRLWLPAVPERAGT